MDQEGLKMDQNGLTIKSKKTIFYGKADRKCWTPAQPPPLRSAVRDYFGCVQKEVFFGSKTLFEPF